MSSNPGLGADVVIQIDGTDVGYAKSISVSIEVDLIKEYFIGSKTPGVLEPGNQSYRISLEKAFVGNDYAQKVLNGTKVSVVYRPLGTGSGKPEWTFSDVVLTAHSVEAAQDGIVMEGVEGEAKSVSLSTQA